MGRDYRGGAYAVPDIYTDDTLNRDLTYYPTALQALHQY
jgi:hypothetical protein